jgi:hypothetical protein
MNRNETTAQLKGTISQVDNPYGVGGFGSLPAPGGAFEPQSNE